MNANDNNNILPIQHFLDRYKQFSSSWIESRLDAFKMNFGILKLATETIIGVEKKFEEKLAVNFNLFKVLGVQTYEVKTHSALLACLLDPNGVHAQRGLFLESFLKYCYEKFPAGTFPEPPKNIIPENWTVEVEKVTGFGNMDVVIQSRNDHRLIVIENKIYAGEQPEQLARYNEWMCTNDKVFSQENRSLIYLTIDGKASNTSDGVSYHCLAYQYDIQEWLETVINQVKAPRIAVTIEQYLQTIQSL